MQHSTARRSVRRGHVRQIQNRSRCCLSETWMRRCFPPEGWRVHSSLTPHPCSMRSQRCHCFSNADRMPKPDGVGMIPRLLELVRFIDRASHRDDKPFLHAAALARFRNPGMMKGSVSGLSCARAPDRRASTSQEDALNPGCDGQATNLDSGYSRSFTPLQREQRKILLNGIFPGRKQAAQLFMAAPGEKEGASSG